VAEDRTRLSKRKGAMPLSYYREQGYIPDALFNFLALLGWSLGPKQEIASRQEIIQEFSIERVLKTAAYFNPQKLEWMNGQYIQNLDTQNLAEKLVPFLLQKKYIKKGYTQQRLGQIVQLFKPRIKKLADFPELADFLFAKKIKYTAEAKAFLRQNKKTKNIFAKLIKVLNKLSSFDLQTVEDASRQLIADEGIKAGDLIHPVRVALTGRRVGPGLFETMAVLGKEKVLQRLAEAAKLMG
jgi:glutamyl/glutaminyl-tRNA synthetase